MRYSQVMRSIRRLFARVFILFLFALPVAAHHSRAIFDRERTVTIEGVVTNYAWRNPHVHIVVETEDDSGDAVVWDFESGTTTMMRARGWSRDMLAPGDRVVVEAHPVTIAGRTNADVVSIQKAGVTLVDGGTNAPILEPEGSAPLTADGLSGVWLVPYTPLIPQFSNPSTWSLTARGFEAVEAYDGRTMNPQNECMARAAPWLMIFSGVQRIDVADDTVLIQTEYDTVERTVHMDASSHDGASVSYQGHSIGWWEEDVLVVDTTHFADHRNGNARGVPSGSQKHLVERFELTPDGASLSYSFVLEDPEYMSTPVTGELQSTHRPDLGFDPVSCDLDTARRWLD